MLVIDNDLQREIIISQLKTWKMETFTASSIQDAGKYGQSYSPVDLLVVDLQLMDISEIKTIGGLLKYNPNLGFIAVGFAGQNLPPLYKAYFKRIIIKPFRQQLLLFDAL